MEPVPRRHLLVGFGLTNQAVARALLNREHEVRVVDDAPGEAAISAAARLGLELEAPATLGALVGWADWVLPTPGLPETHPLFDAGVEVRSELDLAAAWDDRPVIAVTGTDGKTTVCAMVAHALDSAGRAAVEAGNNDLPLVAAVDDPEPELFVVEASSFRLGHSVSFSAEVGTWLNFAPDHLDVHRDLGAYEAAKASMWARQSPWSTAVGNADDPVVARHLADAPGAKVSFGLSAEADWTVLDGWICGPGEEPVIQTAALARSFPHDVANALATAATVTAVGVDRDAVAAALASFEGLPHRLARVAERDGIGFYDDSKATVPHATLSALASFDSAVLIAGGRNKGLDLSVLSEGAGRLRGVVAIGEAAPEVEAAFAGVRPVVTATTMADAVHAANRMAEPGDVVLLSPACASYDWYSNYGERGRDFAAAVHSLGDHK